MSPARRAFDLVVAGVGLLVLAPLLAVIAGAVWVEDRRAVFFRQERIGYKGEPFRIWKFRTMVVGADRAGALLTVGGDARVTRVGHWLRRSKLDELPQLVNVLAGTMRLVGPRPEVPRYVARYTPEQRAVLDCIPGMTDPASLTFRDESALLAHSPAPEATYVRDILPAKIRLSVDYASRATLWSDVSVVLLTLASLVPGSDALVQHVLRRIRDRRATSLVPDSHGLGNR